MFYYIKLKMTKTYIPIVVEETENLISGLMESDFFSEHQITNLTYARNYILNKMTEKYVAGILTDDDEPLFTEEEFTQMLKEIIVGSALYDLKEKGLLDSYEDENTEETFFLTEKGKDVVTNFEKFIEKSNKP